MTTLAPETKSIVVERVMPHAPAKIWRALTQSALIAEWLMRNDFQPVVGHRFHFHATPIPGMWNGTTDSEVLEVVPEQRLAYSWNASGEEAEGGLKSVVTWTLTPVEGGVLVRMEHTGFRPQDEAGRQGMGGGWPRILGGLERVAGQQQ
ncbi:MAG: SRPBCC domain-containing protein [Caulobacterales bacterium]|nr:SRPBCC domain-containing protein [Caulobacterales bacterium]